MKLYREVKASERLPDKNGIYICKYTAGSFGSSNYILHKKQINKAIEDTRWLRYVEFWLEPFEVSEEDIDNIIYHRFKHGSGSYSENSILAAKEIKQLIG